MKQYIFLGLISLLLISCKQKYEITNMLAEKIDVTSYIESGEFRTDSCENDLNRLVRINPLIFDNTYETQLQNKLEKWKTEYNTWLSKNNRHRIDFSVSNLISKTTYQYSYFITDEPIDVYRTDLGITVNGIANFRLFIRLDKNGHIFDYYKDGGWIINSCDSLNSRTQDIYGHPN